MPARWQGNIATAGPAAKAFLRRRLGL